MYLTARIRRIHGYGRRTNNVPQWSNCLLECDLRNLTISVNLGARAGAARTASGAWAATFARSTDAASEGEAHRGQRATQQRHRKLHFGTFRFTISRGFLFLFCFFTGICICHVSGASQSERDEHTAVPTCADQHWPAIQDAAGHSTAGRPPTASAESLDSTRHVSVGHLPG